MRKAYLLTCDENSNRTIFSENVLKKIGFDVKKIICEKIGQSKAQKVLSNKLNMQNIYKTISEGEDNYAYIFEDDINLVEDIDISEIIEYENISEMFFYLGACFPSYSSVKKTGLTINSHEVYSVSGSVRCLHAVGLSKKGAIELFDIASKHNRCMDVILEGFSRKYRANIVRFDLISPINRGHRGILFQDRKKFPSTI